MNATLVIEHRFKKDSNGKIYASSNSVNTMLWERYLEVFDRLTIVARIQDVSDAVGEEYLVSHEKVDFVPIPYYVGPRQFVKQYFKIKKVISTQVNYKDAYIIRLPSILGNLLINLLKKQEIPYIVEVVADPWEVFSSGSFKSSLSLFHKYRSYLYLKRNVYNAKGVIYVTANALQTRYPSNVNAIVTNASNVILRKNKIALKPKIIDNAIETIKIVSIGSLEQMYKSPDVVLRALKILKDKNVKLNLVWLGDGVYKKDMLKLCKELGLNNEVKFKGNVSSEEVENELKSADLFIHVSRTEGLPRALIEAMANGLPCIGSKVGGIPELLEPSVLIDKNNVDQLVDKIYNMLMNKKEMNANAKYNLNKAKDYEFELLRSRRNKIYRTLLNK
jgi:glycosyltransferase involved in cell wall biosynthesis